jgi:hypothetical protein
VGLMGHMGRRCPSGKKESGFGGDSTAAPRTDEFGVAGHSHAARGKDSAFRIPHSAFRIPHSTFHIPHPVLTIIPFVFSKSASI